LLLYIRHIALLIEILFILHFHDAPFAVIRNSQLFAFAETYLGAILASGTQNRAKCLPEILYIHSAICPPLTIFFITSS